MQDFKYAFRMMRMNPVFSAAAILTLALGIGASTALFSVVNGVLLSPLPFANGHELALVWTANRSLDQDHYLVSPQDFGSWTEQQQTFDGLAAYWRNRVTVSRADGDPTAMQSVLVSANFFEIMDVKPRVGRLFAASDGIPGQSSVAVLSHDIWQRMYGGDPAIVGRAIEVDGQPIEVVGVLEPGAEWPRDGEVWTSINFPWTIMSREARWLTAIGRVSDGGSLEAAQADMDQITTRLGQEFPGTNAGWSTELESLTHSIVGDTRRSLMLLLGATGLVLLIACANVSNLLLSRSEARSQEIAVRTAFGAGRARLARQLLTESMVMAGVGALLGVGLAYVGLRALVAVAPVGIPRLESVAIDGTVLAVAAGVTLLSVAIFGLAPLVKLLRPHLGTSIKEGARGSRGPRGSSLQSALVVTQLSLAVPVVVGAGLLVQSFENLSSSDPGFVASDAKLTFELELTQSSYPEDTDVMQFYDRFITNLRDQPRVLAATMVSSLPLQENRDFFQNFTTLDQAMDADADMRAYYRQVDAQFFEVMGTRVIDGRGFNAFDRMEAEGVAVINESLARLYWGEDSPVGQRLGNTRYQFGPLGSTFKDEVQIVGVVADVKFEGLRSEANPAIFMPYSQTSIRRMTIVAEGIGGTDGVLSAARTVLRGLDPSLAVSTVVPIERVMAAALSYDRFSMLLLGTFGVVALVLAAIGIYGVLAYGVERRVREVGIRIALGASGRAVLKLVMLDGVRMTLLGLAVGLGATFALSGAISSQLFGVGARDPAIYLGVAGALGAVAVLASFVPARRATRISPITALRQE